MSESSLEDGDLRAIIEAYDAAWNRHALDAIVAYHTLDSVFESHTTAEIAIGHDDIRRMIARYFRTFPDLTFTIRRMYARLGLVVQEWTAQATHAVPILTRHGLAAPTGRVLTWSGVDMMPMAGSLIVRKDAYADSASLQLQIEAARLPRSEAGT
ncbi:MAG TPA: ester cyclase [Polyangia bacterium]